jgi:hypothetical protein
MRPEGKAAFNERLRPRLMSGEVSATGVVGKERKRLPISGLSWYDLSYDIGGGPGYVSGIVWFDVALMRFGDKQPKMVEATFNVAELKRESEPAPLHLPVEAPTLIEPLTRERSIAVLVAIVRHGLHLKWDLPGRGRWSLRRIAGYLTEHEPGLGEVAHSTVSSVKRDFENLFKEAKEHGLIE